MTDNPRDELRTLRAHWLVVRANVRAVAAQLRAAQHALSRDALRSDDPQMSDLVLQLDAQRRVIDGLAGEIDQKLSNIHWVAAAIEAEVRAHAGKVSPKTTP